MCTVLEAVSSDLGPQAVLELGTAGLQDIVLPFGFVGGWWHLLGAVLMHSSIASGDCGRVMGTLELLVQDGHAHFYAPYAAAIRVRAESYGHFPSLRPDPAFATLLDRLHAAVWMVALAQLPPLERAPTYLWALAAPLCSHVAGKSGEAALLHCYHGVGHSAMLLAATLIDGAAFDACKPPRIG